MHDVIDNRKEKLIDHINKILDSTEKAKFNARFSVARKDQSFYLPFFEELLRIREWR